MKLKQTPKNRTACTYFKCNHIKKKKKDQKKPICKNYICQATGKIQTGKTKVFLSYKLRKVQ